MTALVADKLRDLGRMLADLKVRVRAALATELGRHVAAAVEDVVRAMIAGRTPLHGPMSYRADRVGPSQPWTDDGWDRPGDPWAADPDRDEYDHDAGSEPPVPSPAGSGLAAAVAAGVFAARWWLARRGTVAVAAGIGLAVGLLGVLGGPVARTTVAALAAAADLLAATDALGGGAARLDRP